MKYDNANEVLELLDFDKMNNHTLYSIFSLCDTDTRKKVLESVDNVKKNKIVWGCRNLTAKIMLSKIDPTFKTLPKEEVMGYFYTDKHYVIDLLLNKRLPNSVLFDIVTSTDKSIISSVLDNLPEKIIDKIIRGSGYAKDKPHYLSYPIGLKWALITNFIEFSQSLNPYIFEHLNIKLD